MNCVLCGIRKPKRQCPGVNGAICSICCGTEREQSIDCPLDCIYLKEAHRHERPPVVDPAALPNQDIRVPESFLQTHQWLLVLLGSAVADGALREKGTTDYDVREALESLIQTFRGSSSGLIIESRPINLFAANVQEAVQDAVARIRQRITDAGSESKLDDSTILAMLAFLQRLEYANNNGRRRSRAFLDFLLQFHVRRPFSMADAEEDLAETVEPEAPRVIL